MDSPPPTHPLDVAPDVVDTMRNGSGSTDSIGHSHRSLDSDQGDPALAPIFPQSGDRIGPYLLQEPLGAGVSCFVFRGWDEDHGCPVAVKIVNWGNVYDRAAAMKQMRTEASCLARVKHPRVVRFIDFGFDPRWPYIVTEFVEGRPVGDLLRGGGALPPEWAVYLVSQVVDGLGAVWRAGLVHRDIKPDNILVAQDGTPKLLDFGVAKLLNQGDAAPADELPRTWLLTPDYASPEQLSGRAVSTASDVYSLGVLLHVLLTGVRPYTLHGSTPGDLQAQLSGVSLRRPSDVVQAGGDAARLAERRAGTPPRLARTLAGDLDAILLKALSPSPAARYASVDQFAADLDRHRTHRPVEARAAGLSYVAGRLVRRHRVALAVAAAMVLVVAAGIAAILWQAALAREAQARAERRFDDVRRLARSFIFDVHDAIVNVPGTTAARSTMVRTAVTYLDSLAREARGDRGLQRELADAFVKVGDAQGHPTSANIGDTAGARASYLRAIEIAGALTAEDPAEVEAARTLAMAHRRLADVLAWGGGLGDALRHAETSRQLFAGLGGAAHASGDDRFQAVVAEIKLGDLLGNPNFPNANRHEDAAARYRVAQAELRALAAAAPADARFSRYLGLVLERLGAMHEVAGDWAAAEGVYRESFEIRSALAARVRLHMDIQRDLAIAHEKLGNVRRALGRDKAAIESYRSALAQFEHLARTDPSNAIAARSVGISREKLADVLVAVPQRAEAVALLRGALGTYRRLGERDPENAQTRCDLKRVAERLADVLQAAPEPRAPHGEACGLWRESLTVTEELRARGGATCAGDGDPIRLAAKLRRCG